MRLASRVLEASGDEYTPDEIAPIGDHVAGLLLDLHRGAEREVFPSVAGKPAAERPGVVTYTTTRWGHLCDPRRTPRGERTPSGTDCYRFALSHPQVDVALAGPANEAQMDQALRALELGPMDEEELAWMRRVGDHIYGGDRTSGLRDGV